MTTELGEFHEAALGIVEDHMPRDEHKVMSNSLYTTKDYPEGSPSLFYDVPVKVYFLDLFSLYLTPSMLLKCSSWVQRVASQARAVARIMLSAIASFSSFEICAA